MGFLAWNGAWPPAAALAIVLAAAVLLRLLWRKIGGREPGRPLKWLAQNTATPVFLLIVAAGAQVIFGRLAQLPRVRDLPVTPYLSGASYVLTALSVAWVVYGLLKGMGEWCLSAFRAPTGGPALNSELFPALRLAVKVLLIFVAGIVVLDHYGVKLTAVFGVAGVASLMMALAAQDTLANLIAGFSILLDRPFRPGDRVELADGRIGDVQEIGLRSTKILSFDHTYYVVPNSEMAKSSVVNHSYPSDRVKVRQTIAAAYGSDVTEVKRLLIETCRAHPLVLREPAPEAFLTQLGEATLQVTFAFWIDDFRQRARVADEIHTSLYERFQQAGIPMPARRDAAAAERETLRPRNR